MPFCSLCAVFTHLSGFLLLSKVGLLPGGLGLVFAGGHCAVVYLVIQQDFVLGQHKIALPGGVQRRVAVCIGPGQIYMVGAAFQFYQVPGVGGVLGHAADLCAPQICLAAKVFKSAGIALTNGRPALDGAVGGGRGFAAGGVVVISGAQGDHRCQVAVLVVGAKGLWNGADDQIAFFFKDLYFLFYLLGIRCGACCVVGQKVAGPQSRGAVALYDFFYIKIILI